MEEQNKETEIRLQDLWSILKHCWWQMLIILIALAVFVYIGLTLTHEDEYTATLSLYVMATPNEENQGTPLGSTQISVATNLINDCEILIKSRDQVLRPVAMEIFQDEAWIDKLDGMLSVSRADSARVLYLKVTTSSAERSAEIVNALGDQACTYFNGMYDQRLMNVVDQAEVPQNPSNPISPMTVLLIAFVGAVAVYGIHFLKFILDDKINNAEDVERYLGLSMLGVIPNKHDSSRRKSKYGYYAAYRADSNSERPQK